MATRQGIDTAVLQRFDDDHVFVFFAVKAEFDTSTIAVHTSSGELSIGGTTYEGAGTLLNIESSTDDSDLKSDGITVSLNGMTPEVLTYALTENYQNRPITVLQGFLDASGSRVTGTMVLFKGRMQNISLSDDPEGNAAVVVSAENRLIDLRRPSNLRYTKESQETVSSGDTGFNRVQSMVEKKIVWGQKQHGGVFGADIETTDEGGSDGGQDYQQR